MWRIWHTVFWVANIAEILKTLHYGDLGSMIAGISITISNTCLIHHLWRKKNDVNVKNMADNIIHI